MKHLSFEYLECNDLVESFGKKKIEERYDSIYEAAESFISANGLSEVAYVNKYVLANVIIDYYNDIKRIKSFHQKIEKVNSQKVMAYLSYWFLRRKPIQLKNEQDSEMKKTSFINEKFILNYIFSYLSVREKKCNLLLRENVGLKNFSQAMLYYLIYRLRDPQSLEMVLIAFMAGQIYEQTEVDISNELHPYDVTD